MFELSALQRFAIIIGNHFSGSEINELFRKSNLHRKLNVGTKWKSLYSIFEELQNNGNEESITSFIETACNPQEFFGKMQKHGEIIGEVNEVLSFYDVRINEKGKINKIVMVEEATTDEEYKTNHSKLVTIETNFVVDTSIGMHVIPYRLSNVGKANHSLSISFHVNQHVQDTLLDVKFYILSEEQFFEWLPRLLVGYKTNTYPEPQNRLLYSNRVDVGNYRFPVQGDGQVYLVFDNRYSVITAKRVSLSVGEDWDDVQTRERVTTVIPPENETLKDEIERLISTSKQSLKIISPYMDMTLINRLLKKKRENVDVKIILRSDKQIVGAAKDGLIQIQRHFSQSYRLHDEIHSRLVIRDNIEAIVSSADLTQKSLQGQMNLGVTISNNAMLLKILEYFDLVWKRSKPL